MHLSGPWVLHLENEHVIIPAWMQESEPPLPTFFFLSSLLYLTSFMHGCILKMFTGYPPYVLNCWRYVSEQNRGKGPALMELAFQQGKTDNRL